jgi:hypothetical protein
MCQCGAIWIKNNIWDRVENQSFTCNDFTEGENCVVAQPLRVT